MTARLCYNTGAARHGQATLEYVLALAALLVVVAILSALVGTREHPGVIDRYAARTENLVTADCP